jgi:hypothetical protein
VSAETDAIYTPVRGVVFASYSVNVIADQAELCLGRCRRNAEKYGRKAAA